jgi:hypothetical protein
MAVVSAGLIAKDRRPVEGEKSITSLRRNPLILMAGPSDCAAQLGQLAALQKSRNAVVRTARKLTGRGTSS